MTPNRATQLALSLTVALGLGPLMRPTAAGPMYSAARPTPGQTEPARVDLLEPGAQPLRWVVDHPSYGEEPPASFAADFLEPVQVASAESSVSPNAPRLAEPEGTAKGSPPSLASSGAINPAALSVAPLQAAPVSHPDQAVAPPPTPAATPIEAPPSLTYTVAEDHATRDQDSPDAAATPTTDATNAATDQLDSNTSLTPPSPIEPTGAAAPSGTPDAPPSGTSATNAQSQIADLPAGEATIDQSAAIHPGPGTTRDPQSSGSEANWDQPFHGEGSIIGESLVLAISGTERPRATATEDGQALDLNGLLKTAMGVELARASAITDAGRILAEPDYQATWETVGGGSGSLGVPATATAPPPPLTTPEPATWILFAALCLPLLHRARRAAASRPVTR